MLSRKKVMETPTFVCLNTPELQEPFCCQKLSFFSNHHLSNCIHAQMFLSEHTQILSLRKTIHVPKYSHHPALSVYAIKINEE